MIKARLESDEGPLLLIGLSDGNLKKLGERLPISFTGPEVGFPEIASILIMSGETEESMAKEILSTLKQKGVVKDGL